ncbi:MAG: DUF72 domain-containing protein [Candidatus Aminicenantes bacterium]|nr:DUF72 domain-containing protein [Candidatus Aminicenantes bacterium]
MAGIYVGTAGWSYEDWKGIVYPSRPTAGFHPLPFLARFINLIEVNSTFYRPPSLPLTLSWVRRIAGTSDFLLAVKLHQVFTHVRKDFSGKDVDGFKTGIEPLVAAGRLAALLLQFPWSYANTPPHRDYLTGLFRLFSGYPLALEVRHATWDDPEILAFLREAGVSFCNIDQPVIGASLRPTAVVTNPAFAYVRLHGRNYGDWFREGAGRDARYNYLYAKDELAEWVDRIKELAGAADRIYVVTNNHYRGQALANALQIKNMVIGEKLDVPVDLIRQYPLLEDIVDRIRTGQLDLFGPGDGAPKGIPKKDGGR